MISFLKEASHGVKFSDQRDFVEHAMFACVLDALESRKKALLNSFLDGRFPGEGLPGVLLREQEVGRALEAEATIESLKELYSLLTNPHHL